MADENYIIQVKLAGSDLSPLNVNARDVGRLITAVQDMLAAIIAHENPDLGLAENQVVIGLAEIREGSYLMGFATIYLAPALLAYRTITESIENGVFDNLPQRVIDALIDIRTITRIYGRPVEFLLQNGTSAKLAQIDRDTKITNTPKVIKGGTTLYGRVTKVGGENPPRAKIVFLDGTELNCHITQSNDYQVARELGQRLYDTVGIRGRAAWNVRDMSLIDFTIESVLPYRAKPIMDNLGALREAVGNYLEGVTDIDAYIHELRGNGDAGQ